MAWFEDVGRLVNGVSLVAKEYANRSQILQTARRTTTTRGGGGGDLETLVSSSLKKALVSVTDLVGFTKGTIHAVPPPSPTSSSSSSNNQKRKQNVVYFTDSPPQVVQEPTSSSPSSSSINVQDDPKISEIQQGGKNVVESKSSPSTQTENKNKNKNKINIAIEAPPQTQNVNVAALTDDKDKDRIPAVVAPTPVKRKPRKRRVPSTPFTRALGFAGLGAGLAWGTVQESAKRLVYGTPQSKDNQPSLSPFLSEQNAERLALALCRMRGAALKLGQMLSIQDESLVPAPILAALDIVRQGADVMPSSQLNQVLDAELGPGWTSKLQSFDYEPMAAASIGQVHRAVTKDGKQVAMKIQYPGVADSIDSDLENVKLLLNYTNLIPKGLYLDSAMKVAKQELSQECNYELEAASQKRFRDLLCEKIEFYVPLVFEDISSRRVITTELVPGVPIDKVAALNQKTRNYVGKKLLQLTLMELFVFQFMQTDPNWSNFLYDEATNKINLIDFGAARAYPKKFVDDYLRMVLACADCDRDAVIEMSKRLGFLTGMESEIMMDAHVQAGFVIGLPFAKAGGYDFRITNITQSVSNLGATMLRHRLTPPPDEAYSLHRKLSGAFLACIKLGAVVPCRELLLEIYDQYHFEDEDAKVNSSRSSARCSPF